MEIFHLRQAERLYHGMSLSAAAGLGREKGYALIGCDETGVYAFFVRRDLIANGLREQPVEAAYRSHQARIASCISREAQAQIVLTLPLVEV